MLKLILPLTLIMLCNLRKPMWWQSFHSLMLILVMAIPTMQYSSPIIISPFSMLDNMSTSLILLSILISAMMILASTKIYFFKLKPEKFIFLVTLLLMILILAFSSTSLINFYIWFEASLIPTLLIILYWGYQPERLQAGMYLMMYTITASLPMLMMFIYLWYISSSMNMLTNTIINPLWLDSSIPYLLMITGMLVKLPMFTTHLWLPKAHVEAPIAGSMILAAILLKLGGYGLIRMIYILKSPILPTNLIMSISLVGAIFTGMICLRQPDMKSMIAYSSIGHMGLLISGVMTMTAWGMSGALLMMIAHGLCSSAMFILANISYNMTFTRSSYLTKGMMVITPNMSMWWFLILMCNMAGPPSLNLLSEIMLITSISSYSLWTLLLLAPISFITVAYSLNLYSQTQHGWLSINTNPMWPLKPAESTLILTHLAPIMLLILKPEFLLLSW